jgi:hypothetical protein
VKNRTKYKSLACLLVAAFFVVGAMIAAPAPAMAQDAKLYADSAPAKMQAAIEKSLKDEKFAAQTKKAVEDGVKANGKEPGYMGILGAPSPVWWVGLLWAIWVGWIFSTVGAFGGIMAGVGHITMFGLADYAKSFGKGNPEQTRHRLHPRVQPVAGGSERP